MLLYFVRHGQTDESVAWSAAETQLIIYSNLHGIIQGQLDTPLNDHGRLEASKLAKSLESETFARCLSSDLSRASEVRAPISPRFAAPRLWIGVHKDPQTYDHRRPGS